jgi:D-alanyl-D-alanine carboxypeptidase
MFVICLSLTYKIIYHNEARKNVPQEKEQVVQSVEIFDKNVFQNIKIQGRAYVVYDLVNHEVLASKNETTVLPLASLTKVMTAVSSMLHASPETKIIITKNSIEGEYDLGLKNNQVWKLDELLKYTLVFSSNDGAGAVANAFGGRDIFVRQMNDDAKVMGLTSVFTDPAGRDIDGKIGGEGNALDVVRLLEIARKQIPDILDATTKKYQTILANSEKVIGIPNTNQMIESLPGAEGSKTGFTDLAGGNLGVIVDISVGHPVAIVVLGSTRDGRFEDVRILYDTLRKSFMIK